MASLSAELTTLRRLLLTMGAEVEQRVVSAFEALLKHDLRLAEQVRENDDPVDQLDLDVESECATILALHQPVAGDLRYVMAALRINADLERMADLARGIAKRSIKLEYLRPIGRPEALGEMASSTLAMLAGALSALADLDAALADRVRADDKAVDRLNKALITWAVHELAGKTVEPKAVVDLITIVRTIERIADLACNIAESVVFAAEGRIVRHAPVPSEPR
jgi:phosphate transport system protein